MADLSQFVKELDAMIQQSSSSPSNEIVVPPSAVSASPNTVASPSSVPAVVESNGKKLKLLVVTTHPNQINGYSKVIYNLLQQLNKPWLQVVVFGTQRLAGAELNRTIPSSIKLIDASAQDKEKEKFAGFALSELPNTIRAEKPDVVLIYNDLSIICAYIEALRNTFEHRTFKLWAYVDTTYPSSPQAMIDMINRDVDRVFCFTKSWKDSLKAQGITRPLDVMNHGIDPQMFRPIPREVARQNLGLPKDMFLFTSVNKNIPRKRLDLVVIAFVKLIIRFPMKPIFLLMVADHGDRGGFQLFNIFSKELKAHGASIDLYGNRLLITAKDTCYKDEDINLLYNAGHAGISCAEGEGFGLCSFEQMAVGVPQIAPAIHGYTEYCTEENSLLVKPSYRCYVPSAYHSVAGEAHMVRPEDVADAMEQYVVNEELRTRHGRLAKEKALSYTWEKCAAPLVKRLKALLEDEDD
jgi:glycosyltransferase involved in cell wall biosynthesis